MLRQAAEEIRANNENERIANETTRQKAYADMIEKSMQYDMAESERVESFSSTIQSVNESKMAIEALYSALQENYSALSQQVNSSIANCENVIDRCEIAAKVCEDIAANGYVTNDQLTDYATKQDLANIDLSGMCKLVKENGKVYLEVV